MQDQPCAAVPCPALPCRLRTVSVNVKAEKPAISCCKNPPNIIKHVSAVLRRERLNRSS